MAEDRTSTEQGVKDRVVDEVVEKVERRPSIDADHDDVRARAEDAVDELVDQPVQTFTPLLAENEVVSGLLADKHRGAGDEPAGR